jgi:hypothetical protein
VIPSGITPLVFSQYQSSQKPRGVSLERLPGAVERWSGGAVGFAAKVKLNAKISGVWLVDAKVGKLRRIAGR